MKKIKKKDFFDEQYIVVLNYKKPDGNWVWSHKIDVFVSVRHGINEKNNHEKAERAAKKLFRDAK